MTTHRYNNTDDEDISEVKEMENLILRILSSREKRGLFLRKAFVTGRVSDREWAYRSPPDDEDSAIVPIQNENQ